MTPRNASALEDPQLFPIVVAFSGSVSTIRKECTSEAWLIPYILGLGTKTVTSTAPVPTVKATTTVTNTVPSTSITFSTKTDAVTSTITTVTETATSITTQNSTSTTTVQAGANGGLKKRDVARPACVANGIPASQLSANCKCLSITSTTITTTFTPAAVTLTTTATALATTIVIEQRTTFITVTKGVTATDKITTLTTTSTTTIVRETPVAVCAAPAPSAPAGNILRNPSFSDRSLAPWSPTIGGTSGVAIVGDATCGYSVNLAAKSDYSSASLVQYIGEGHEFETIHRFTVNAKKISGDGTGCQFRLFCDSQLARGNGHMQTDVAANSIPNTWTQYSVDCYEVIGSSGGQISLEAFVACPASDTGPPITIAVDEISLVKI